MSRLPLKGLETFNAVARTLSFSLAAKALFVSQGAVSKQIKHLEDHLGTKLFYRGTRSPVELTATGRILALSIQPAFGLLEQAANNVRPARAQSAVTISTVPSLAAHWLIPRLDDFRAQYPGIDIHIETGYHLADLERGDADIAIRYGRGRWPRTISNKLSNGVVIPVCSPEYADSIHLRQPDDLLHCTLLHNGTYAEWRLWFERHDLPYPGKPSELLLEDLNVVIQSGISSQGVALVPKLLIESAMMRKILVSPISAPLGLETAFYVVQDANDHIRAQTELVIQWLLSHAMENEQSTGAQALL